MQFCKRCLYGSNHPLGIIFNEEGICSGCIVHEEKDQIDWVVKLEKIKKLTKKYKSKSGKNYDCIVPVTGGGDSYYTIHLVKNVLGLNPLLVSYNKYYNTNIGIKNLANLRILFNCDILIQNINPISVKKVTKTTIREFGSIYWHVLAGQTSFPVQIAVTHKIPLIIWGAHQGMEQVGMFSHNDEVQMTRRYRKEHDLMGYEADDLISIFDTLNLSDVWQYRYPDDYDLDRIGVKGIYLNNYFRWDPLSQHRLVIKNFGYKTLSQNRTFYSHDHMDCFNYINLHDHIKYIKHGYTKVLDHVCREIRHRRISRDDAIKIVSIYQNKNPKHLKLFSDWLDIPFDSLKFILKQLKNKHSHSQAYLKNFLNKKKLIPQSKIEKIIKNYVGTESLYLEGKEYVTFGKGYP